MSRKRSVMKPITDLWWRYYSTNRKNLCTVAAVENSDTLTTPNFWPCKWY
jgi:hypothetical protein